MTPEDIARLQEEENQRRIAAGIASTPQGRTPSQVAAADRLARQYNIGTPLVESDPKTYEQLDKRDQVDMLTDLNPWTTKHLIDNPDTGAMMTAPDISKMSNISAALGMDKPTHDYSLNKINPLPVTPPSDFGPVTPQVSFGDLMASTAHRVLQYAPAATRAVTMGPGAAIAPAVTDFAKAGYQDFQASGETAPQYLSRYARAAPGEALLGVVGAAQGILGLMEGATSLASSAVGASDPLYDWYRQQDQIAQATQKLYTPEWAKTDFQQGVLSGMQSLTQMGITAPFGGEGVPWALGGMVTGQGINQFRARGAGALPSVLGGAAQGAIEIATERYLGGFGHGASDAAGFGGSYLASGAWLHPSLHGTANFLWHEIAGEQLATAGQNFTDFLVPGSQFKTWHDFVQQAPSQAMQTLWATLLMGGSIGATGHALNMFRSTVDQHKDAVEGVYGHAVLDQIMENAKDAPMRKGSPEAFANFVQDGAKDSPVTHVYVPIEAVDRALNDPEIPQEEKAALTVYQSQIDEARVNNGDVVIPVGEAAAHLAGTKIWDNVKDDARVLAGGISAKEAHQHMDELINNLEKVGDAAIEEGNAAMPQLEAKQTVYNDVKAQVLKAGRSEREAQTTAALVASRAEALASPRYGQFKDAQAAWKWMQLQIVGPEGKTAGKATKVAQAEQNTAPLEGMPQTFKVNGQTEAFGPHLPAREAAARVAAAQGLDYRPPQTYARVDPVRAQRIAAEFEAMQHNPNDPETKAAYAAMIKETIAQFKEIQKTGLKIEFIPKGAADPYGNPRNAILDVTKNNHLWVYPTDSGFGSSDLDVSDNPLLKKTGIKIGGRELLANDVFRIVHDYFGHIKEGVGFRATGEENAWRMHSAMYSPLARRAMTTETRGQNSWVNFGPHGEANRTASSENTVYADQKIGLLPQWVSEEGAADEPVDPNVPTFQQAAAVGGYEGMAAYLTDEERANLREASKQKILSIVESLPDAEEMAAVALAGRAKRGWYENSAQAILDVFGAADAPRFAALLAALSPQNSVESNLFNALKTWTNWNNAGRPTDRRSIVNIMGDSVQGGKGVGSLLNAWINNSVSALQAEDPAKIKLSGPKVDSFMNNLVGVIDEVTNDTWMANYANVDPASFAGRGKIKIKSPGYKAMNVVVRAAADILTKKTGESWSPAEVQETVWSLAKTVYEMRDQQGETRTMAQLLAAGHVTHDDIASTPDFGVLFADGLYHTILEEGGYSTTGSLGRNRRAVGVDGKESVTATPEGSGFSQDDFQRFLTQAAHRLEEVRARRRGITVAEDQYGFPFEDVLSSEQPDAVLYQFGGVRAASNDAELSSKYADAKDLEEAGETPERIWAQTGWIRGPEGHWRFEIDDSKSALKSLPSPDRVDFEDLPSGQDLLKIGPLLRVGARDYLVGERLSQVLDHPQLFKLYPFLSSLPVFMQDLDEREHGYYNGREIILNANNAADEILSTLHHEIQHAIQSYEGFAHGATAAPGALRDLGLGAALDEEFKHLKAIANGEVPGLTFPREMTDKELMSSAAFNTYERVAGENEARAVQSRLDFTPEERQWNMPVLQTTEYGDPVLLPQRTGGIVSQSTSGPKAPRGETSFFPNGRTIVQLFKADFSTMLHEMSHVFLEQELRLAQMDGASDELKADVEKLKKWFKANGADIDGDAAAKTAAHELFARTGERYFREGKAPSAELRSAFKQFREWLTGVYKSVKDLLAYGPAPINPEISKIFDRIIATQDAIDYNSTQPMSQEELGMTSAEYEAYLSSVKGAQDRAFDILLEKMMKSIAQRDQKAIRAQRSNVREEVAQKINSEPRFVALHLLRTGRWLNDPSRERTDVKINTGWLIDNYGEEILKQLPVGLQPIHRGDGVNGDEVAQLVGMKSGDALVKALVDLKRQADALKSDGNPRPLRDQLIEDQTDKIMAERHGDIAMSPEQIREEAIAAINSNRQGEVLATELRQLKKKAAQPGVITPYQILREWARRKAYEGTVADAVSKETLNRYIRLFNKARTAFENAIIKGDTDEAIKQKQAQMINHALLAEGKKVADDIGDVVKRMQRYAKTKALASIDQDYMDRIHELLEGYNFRTVSNKLRNEKASFEEWAKRQRDQGSEVYVPDRFRDDRTNWKDAQVTKLLELNDMVQSLAHLGKLKQRLMVAEQERRLDELRDEAEASALALPERHLGDASVGEITKPLRQRLREAKTFAQYSSAIVEMFRPGKRVRQAAAGLVKIEGVADILDQSKMGEGAFNRVLIRGATVAANKYSMLREEVLKGIAEAYHAMSGTLAARLNDHVTINELTLRAGLHADDPRLGQPIDVTRRQLLALVANTGNLSNLSKLVGGERWGDPESMVDMTRIQQTLIGYLNKEEMDFVQSLWDGMEKMWPHIVEVERLMTGVVPESVVPMEVNTPWGPYKGGYWPVVWDSDRTNLGKPDEETAESNLFGVGSGLGTYKGHTITRTGAMGPMDWSLEQVLFSRTNQILSRIAYAPWIRDSLKLINTPRVSGAIKLRLGNEYFSAMKSWMRDQIPSNAQDIQGSKFWEKILTAARVNMTATVLGISYSVGIAQTEGLTYSAGVLGEGNVLDGPKWLVAGFQSMIKLWRSDGPGPQEFVFARSEEMRRRAHELNREVADVFNRLDDRTIGRLGHIQRQLQAAAFWHVAFIDLNTVSIPTWLGGYEKAKAQGLSEEDAAAYGDKVVRLSQGTGREKDMAAIQRGNAGQRMIAMFYTPSSVFFNQQWEAAQQMKAGNWSKALAPTFWFLIANTLIDAYRSGDWPPKDEDGNVDLESVGKWIGRNLFFGMFYGVPIARDLANTANTKLRGQYADWGSTPLSYGAQSIAKAGTSVMKSIKGEPIEGFDVKREATAAGWLLGLPGLQVGRTAGFIKDVHDDKAEPQNIHDWFEGLTSGKIDSEDQKK